MNKLISIFFISFCFSLIILNYKVFESYKIQTDLLYDINNSTYEYLDKSKNIPTTFPNIGVTSMNLNTIKSSYFIKKQEFDSALNLLQNVKYDPLGMTDVKKAEIYFANTKYDSLFKYAKNAYNKLPNNSAHVIWYLKALALFQQKAEIINLFSNLIKYGNQRDLYFYFATVHNFYNDFKKEVVIAQAIETREKFQSIKNESLNVILNYIIFGEKSFKDYLKLNEKATVFFSQKNYKSARDVYSQMLNLGINKSEVIYNRMICEYFLRNFEEVSSLYSKLEEEENKKTGRFEFLLARSYYSQKKDSLACVFFKKAKFLGATGTDPYIKNICPD